MKITKFAHACLLVEEGNTRIIVDPGSWNETPDTKDVDAILVTHEHGDHMDLEQIRDILARNPSAQVVTHEGAGKLLADAGIPYTKIEEGGSVEVRGVSIESFGHDHAIIYGPTSPCQNTGFLIAGRLFIPGDALHDVPSKPVEILALPTGGPWMKPAEAIDYAKKVAPKVVFPIHDAMYIEEFRESFVPRMIGGQLESAGIAFRNMGNGATEEF